MRNFKFRGKRLDNGEWVYGGIHQTEFATTIIVEEGVLFNPASVNGAAEYDYETRFYDVNPATVGQYIGNKDEGGVEIYAGDIVKDDQIMAPMAVYYSVDYSGFRLGRRGEETPYDKSYALFSDYVSVLGNIHDTPGALEVSHV